MAEKDISALLEKYKQAQASGRNVYFDADEFIDLIDYFDREEDLDTARIIINMGLGIHPGSTPLLIKKGRLYVYEGDYAAALALLDAVTEYDFDLYLLRIECYLHQEEYRVAYALSEEMLEKEDTEPLDNVFAELGFLHVEADCFKEAALFFEESLKLVPDNVNVLTDLSYAYEMQGEVQQAIQTTNRLLDIEPYSYETWVNLGKLYSVVEQYSNAIDAFDFALTVNDSDETILKLKAHCLSLSGRTVEAIAVFSDLLVANPDDVSAYFLLTECYQAMEMYDEALSSLRIYEMLEGGSEELYAKKAQLLMFKGDLDKALNVAEAGLVEIPGSMDIQMTKAEILLKQGEYVLAHDMYNRLHRFYPHDSYLSDKLSIISIKAGNFDDAIYYTKSLLESEPDNLAVKERLALLYFEVDDKEAFSALIDGFSDKELASLFDIIYEPEHIENFDRESLISYLNKARETRSLFKNLEY
ncbi:tetratricopeptide repeat protein [Dysgonomonas sp. 511]|uniref:tetratricopeptide repeat protein n=1 Tax=Dysgonomonas sp. 511 TaxID=2302930 RepID=UPI0013CFE085|nr:tetratricopeptide repeat protein [Dysgonomonas sp. 511]NDV77923.1 hypothetical protein [Dysgonomonas sp. 511]